MTQLKIWGGGGAILKLYPFILSGFILFWTPNGAAYFTVHGRDEKGFDRQPDRKQQDGRRRSVEEGSGRRHSYKRAGWSMSTKKTAVVDVNDIFMNHC